MSRWDVEPMPEWVSELDAACAADSQNRVAKRLNFSAATISQVRRGVYPGSYDGVELAVRGKIMGGKIDCPSLGYIPADICLKHQRRARQQLLSNPERVRMFRACNACARFTKEKIDG